MVVAKARKILNTGSSEGRGEEVALIIGCDFFHKGLKLYMLNAPKSDIDFIIIKEVSFNYYYHVNDSRNNEVKICFLFVGGGGVILVSCTGNGHSSWQVKLHKAIFLQKTLSYYSSIYPTQKFVGKA